MVRGTMGCGELGYVMYVWCVLLLLLFDASGRIGVMS